MTAIRFAAPGWHVGWRRRGLVVALMVGGGLVSGRPPAAEGGGPPQVGVEVPATAMDQSVGPANNSPLVVSDPTDPQLLVLANRIDGPDFSCALQLSGDGGASWAPAQPVTALPPGAEKCYGPEVAFDRTGLLYYLFVGLAGAGNEPVGAFLVTSEDRGRSFSAPRPVLGPANFSVRMGIDPGHGTRGRLHLVWLHAGADPPLGGFAPSPNPILSSYSDDGGASFSEPVQVNDPERARVVAPALVVGSKGAVDVAYYDLGRDAVEGDHLAIRSWHPDRGVEVMERS